MTIDSPKQVLENFTEREGQEDFLVQTLKKVLDATYDNPSCSVPYVVREIVEDALAEVNSAD